MKMIPCPGWQNDSVPTVFQMFRFVGGLGFGVLSDSMRHCSSFGDIAAAPTQRSIKYFSAMTLDAHTEIQRHLSAASTNVPTLAKLARVLGS